MKDNKTKNSARNVFFGFALKIFDLLIPFVIRTIIIYFLGIEYAGLNSLFVSIFQVLNIAELGVGFAMTVSMYKPIVENDNLTLCALIRLYRNYYRIIGLVILLFGLLLTPTLPYLIKGDIPGDINLYVLYFVNLGTTVFSYWLFAYRNSLLSAHQRQDIISKITLSMNFAKYGIQIALLSITKNYYFYIITNLLFQILINVVTAIISKKMYPEVVPKGELALEEKKCINRQIKDLFFSQIGMVVTLSVDSIVISIFLGLVPLGIYQNYYYILSAIIAFFTIFHQSVRASVGTNFLTKPNEENYIDFKFISFIVFLALSFSITCLICLYQPFMRIWVGEDLLLDDWCVLLFGIYLLVYELARLITCYKDYAGLWHKDRFRPLVTAIVNLTLNIILVNFIGIYGILISTIVAFVIINIPWGFRRVFLDVFDKKYEKDYFLYVVKNILLILVSAITGFVICLFLHFVNIYLDFIIKMVLAISIGVIPYLLFNVRNNNVKKTIIIAKSLIHKKKQI